MKKDKNLFRVEWKDIDTHELIVRWETLRRKPQHASEAGQLLAEIMLRSMAMCHGCGRRLCTPFGRAVQGTTRVIDNRRFRFHENCAASHDESVEKVTARPREIVPV